MSTPDTTPNLTWTRIEPGHYTAGPFTIRSEQTTFPIGRRGVVEFRWRLYRDDAPERLSQWPTLAEAKAAAERRSPTDAATVSGT